MQLKLGKTTLVGTALLTLGGGVVVNDAATLDEQPIQIVEKIGKETVEMKQVDNIVEATFPWKDQEGLKVVVDLGEPTIGERMADKRKKEVITEVVDFGEGGFKIDLLLNERPNTNVFCYEIEGAENYDFYYQPELTKEEVEQGAYRPAEIVGSYAVYHKTLANHVEGRENYKTGKVMHIPRPQVWSLANETDRRWADLSYDDGKLCVTVPQVFLDSTNYPVRVDPTFGYTSTGASQQQINSNDDEMRAVTINSTTGGSDGSVTDVNVHVRNFSASSRDVKAAIYTTASAFVSPDAPAVSFNVISGTWIQVPFSGGNPAVSASTSYWPTVFFSNTGSVATLIYFDTGVSGDGKAQDPNSYPTFPGSATFSNNANIYSIYATYTVSGGGGSQSTSQSTVQGGSTTIAGGQVLIQ